MCMELAEKLALEVGLLPPLHFRPKHIHAHCPSVSWASLTVTGKEKNSKEAQEQEHYALESS